MDSITSASNQNRIKSFEKAIALRHYSERREETAMRENNCICRHPLQMSELDMLEDTVEDGAQPTNTIESIVQSHRLDLRMHCSEVLFLLRSVCTTTSGKSDWSRERKPMRCFKNNLK